MRILFFSTLYPNPYRPDKCPFLVEMVKALSALVEVNVVAPVPIKELCYKKQMFDSKYETSTKIYHPLFLYIPKFIKTLDPYFLALAAYSSFKSICSKKKIDIIHANYLYPDGYSALLLAKHFSIPLVATSHGSDINILPNDLRIAHKVSKLIHHANAITSVSSELRAKGLQLANRPDWQVIPNGVDLAKFSPDDKAKDRKHLGISTGDIVIIGVGSFIGIKRFDLLIRIFARLPVENKKLILLGDGPCRDLLMKTAASCGIIGSIIMPGWVPHLDVPFYLRCADLLCISSISEGWPTIILEAMASGTSVVGAPVGGIPEALGYGKHGYVASDSSEEALFEALLIAVNNVGVTKPELRTYASGFDWMSIGSQYVSVYRSVL